jgi:hypothetical protein
MSDSKHDDWNVRPHGPLVEADDGIFTVTGTVHMPVGELPRRMSIVRLANRRLLIFSAVCLDEPGMKKLEALGAPTFLVVPNDHHRLDAMAWKRRYPSIIVVAPAAAREKIEDKVPVDTTRPQLDDPDVTLTPVNGTKEQEVAVEVKRASGTTLIVNDVIANIRHPHGFTGWMLKLMGFAGDEPKVPAPVSLALGKEKTALKQQLLDWSDLPSLKRIIVSHGDPIETNPAGELRKLAEEI